jgi:hypothetical protein
MVGKIKSRQGQDGHQPKADGKYGDPVHSLGLYQVGIGRWGRGFFLRGGFNLRSRFFYGTGMLKPWASACGLGLRGCSFLPGFFSGLFRRPRRGVQGFPGMGDPHREIQAATFANSRIIRLFRVAFGAFHKVIIRGKFLKGLE